MFFYLKTYFQHSLLIYLVPGTLGHTNKDGAIPAYRKLIPLILKFSKVSNVMGAFSFQILDSIYRGMQNKLLKILPFRPN